jgi:hypothetical protein
MKDGEYIRPINMHTHIVTNDEGDGFVSIEQDRFEEWCKQKYVEPYYINLLFLE